MSLKELIKGVAAAFAIIYLQTAFTLLFVLLLKATSQEMVVKVDPIAWPLCIISGLYLAWYVKHRPCQRQQ